MSILRRGRPSRQDPPDRPGIYRFVRKDTGEVTYVGEASNLRKRKYQHTHNGFFEPDDEYFEWQVADGRSNSDTRRDIERTKIKEHNPEKNRDRGGSGRRAHDWRRRDVSYTASDDLENDDLAADFDFDDD